MKTIKNSWLNTAFNFGMVALATLAILTNNGFGQIGSNRNMATAQPVNYKPVVVAKAGWASQTGFRNAETRIQKAIVRAAQDAVGKSSGQSVTTTNGWLTDISDGDGARMRKAIEIYRAWSYAQPNRLSLAQIKSSMISALSGSAYDATRKQKLVDYIVTVVNENVRRGPFLTPTNDNQTLSFLRIRKMCLEWAMSVAIGAGGLSKNYHAAGVGNLSQIRPGMGLYKTDRSHSMIILDIRFDSNGNPVEFRVAESNYQAGPTGGWSNPPGAAPWERTVTTRQGINLNGVKVIDYER